MSLPVPDDHYAAMHAGFRWHVPERFNLAEACCRRWTVGARAAERIAVIEHFTDGRTGFHSYVALQEQANRLANALLDLGVQRGDRVAIVMPQRFETAVAYMAVLQMGAIAMPLSQLFGPEALEYRLQNAGACAAICDDGALASLLQARATCPELRTVIGLGDGARQADRGWQTLLAGAADEFDPVDTAADDPAVLIYTSGTTGAPKGALIPQRVLIGNLPGFVCSHNGFGFDLGALGLNRVCAYGPDDDGASTQAIFWSPADWAWTGGLMDALLPTLYFGRPIVAYNGRFDPQLAFELMARHRVTHSFLFPTALKAMMKAVPHPRHQHELRLQGLMSAGEAVGDAVFAYCRDELDVIVNEMFGQTEVNYIVGNCAMNVAPTLRTDVSALPPEGAQPALGRPGGGLNVAPTLRTDVSALPPEGAQPALGRPGGGLVLDRMLVGWPARPNSMGRAYPGHRITLLDEAGQECTPGTPGEVVIHRRDVHGDADPIFFLGYWNNEAATRAKFTGDWWHTGDVAQADADGYLWYQGRADDVFKSAGYRIGPGEIENCLVKHPAVANCAVVPKPDAARGALVKAYVVLTADFLARRQAASEGPAAFEQQIVAQLQEHVKGLLAPYEYPKEIEFIEQLPMTTTGKVQRRVLRLREEERARAAS